MLNNNLFLQENKKLSQANAMQYFSQNIWQKRLKSEEGLQDHENLKGKLEMFGKDCCSVPF